MKSLCGLVGIGSMGTLVGRIGRLGSYIPWERGILKVPLASSCCCLSVRYIFEFGCVSGCCPIIQFLPCCMSVCNIPLLGSVGGCRPEGVKGAFLPVGSTSSQFSFMLGLFQLFQTFKLVAGETSFTSLDCVTLRSPS